MLLQAISQLALESDYKCERGGVNLVNTPKPAFQVMLFSMANNLRG